MLAENIYLILQNQKKIFNKVSINRHIYIKYHNIFSKRFLRKLHITDVNLLKQHVNKTN